MSRIRKLHMSGCWYVAAWPLVRVADDITDDDLEEVIEKIGRYCDSWTDSEQTFDGWDVAEVECDDIQGPEEYDDTEDIELEVVRDANGAIVVRRVKSEEPE
jgi:hypothetical protein